MGKVLDPEKELRFTRLTQALIFALCAAVCLAIGVTLVTTLITVQVVYGSLEETPFPVWLGWTPWVPLGAFGWLAWHCIRHPYLILSPIGVEIFPFWRPVHHFQVVEWGRIALLEWHEQELTMHYSTEKTSGVVLSLAPLNKKSRILLKQALEGVMEKRKNESTL